MKNRLKFLSLGIIFLIITSFSSSNPHEDEDVKIFLKEISMLMDRCYGVQTRQSSACLKGEDVHISFAFSADYIFNEAHAKKVILDAMREIQLRLKRSDNLSKLLSNSGFDPYKIHISIRVSPKKNHRLFPAVAFLDEIEGSQLINYAIAQDGKIKYYAKLNKFSPIKKILQEETLEKAISDVTDQKVDQGKAIQIPAIIKDSLIHTEFIFRRTWIAVKKKYGLNLMGTLRGCVDKIDFLEASYDVPYLLSREEARNMLFLCMNEMLHETYIDDAILPHLTEGFNEKNLAVTLHIHQSPGYTSYPDISVVSYKNGTITYRSFDPDSRWSTIWRVTESFDDAVSLVDKEKLDLKYISACSEANN